MNNSPTASIQTIYNAGMDGWNFVLQTQIVLLIGSVTRVSRRHFPGVAATLNEMAIRSRRPECGWTQCVSQLGKRMSRPARGVFEPDVQTDRPEC